MSKLIPVSHLRNILKISAVIFFYLMFSKSAAFAHDVSVNQDENFDVANLEEDVRKTTEDLLNLNTEYAKNKSDGYISSLEHAAKDRQASLQILADIKPELILKYSSLLDRAKEFPESVQQYIESTADIQGKLTVLHGDEFLQNGEISNSFLSYLLTNDNLELELKSSEDISAKTGDIIAVKGIRIGDHLFINQEESNSTSSKNSSISIVKPAELNSTVGDQRTLVVLINFQNDQSQPISKQAEETLMFGESGSIREYYLENSSGRTNFLGDVLDWYTLPYDINLNSCRMSTWSQDALNYWVNSGIDISQYSRQIFVFPRQYGCQFGGSAAIGGSPSVSWIMQPLSARVYAHELGHNLGLSHARSYLCPDIWGDQTECLSIEYGDPSSVMGSGYTHFNAKEKMSLGWSDAQALEVTSTGVYTIDRLENTNGSSKLLKIYREDIKQYYYLSFRSQSGYNSNLPVGFGEGVSVHISRNDSMLYSTLLLDMHPETRGDFRDSAMVDGQEYWDRFNNIKIKQISHNSDSVTVEINFEGVPESSLLDEWNVVGDLPSSLTLVPGLDADGYEFIIGAENEIDPTTPVYSVKINSDGTFGQTKTLPSLPLGLFGHQAIINNNFIYVLGGYNENIGSPVNKIFRAQLLGNGEISAWQELQTTLPTPLFYHTVNVYRNKLYIIGGNDNTGPSATRSFVYHIDNNGNLIFHYELLALPMDMLHVKSVIYKNKIYLFPGTSSKVFIGTINESNGDIPSWIESPIRMPRQLTYTSVSLYKDNLIVTGGQTMGGPSSSIFISKINPDGTLNDWSKSSVNLPLDGLFYHSSFVFNNKFYILGGIGLIGNANTRETAAFSSNFRLSDLLVNNVRRDSAYHFDVCNSGLISNENQFKIKLKNNQLGKEYYIGELTSPEPSGCSPTISIPCDVLSNQCNETIDLAITIDVENAVDELNESNNDSTVHFDKQYVDLNVTQFKRDGNYYVAEICNNGGLQTNQTFLLKFTNLTTGKVFTSNPNYRYSVPNQGNCYWTGGLTCGLLSSSDCNDTVNVEVFADFENNIEETNRINNKLSKTFQALLPDLQIEQITRDKGYYKVYICNKGTANSSVQFNLKTTNLNTGAKGATSATSTFTAPNMGSCSWTQGIACSSISSNCIDIINVKVELDIENKILELNESNNTRIQSFGKSQESVSF